LSVEQVFESGEEDLYVDVTRVVSATLVGLIPDHGFRISFSGSQESDQKTRFVKRFATRHTTNTRNRPKLRILFDDTVRDDHENFFFDVSGSIFLNNRPRGTLTNLVSGSSLTSIAGTNCLLITLTSGTFSTSFTGSQHRIGSQFQPGVYSASFAIPSVTTALTGTVAENGEVTFTEIWSSLDRTVAFLSSSITIKVIDRNAFDNVPEILVPAVVNSKVSYRQSEKTRFRLFIQSESMDDITFSKEPLEAKSEIFHQAYYRIKDAYSNDVLIPFDDVNNSTKLSTDSKGMYFDLFMDGLDTGRVYQIDLLVKDSGSEQIFTDLGARFRVDV
jgi:hypothetical protein